MQTVPMMTWCACTVLWNKEFEDTGVDARFVSEKSEFKRLLQSRCRMLAGEKFGADGLDSASRHQSCVIGNLRCYG
jgi:hypothetical protein